MLRSSFASSLRLKSRSANHASSMTSAAVGRAAMSRLSILVISCLAGCETFFQRLLRKRTGSPFAMFSMTLKSSAPPKGGSPTSRMYSMTPMDQRSHFSL